MARDLCDDVSRGAEAVDEAVIAQESAVVAIQAVPSVPARALKETRATLEKMKKAMAENEAAGTIKPSAQ
jgi:hypothetical protein